MYPPHSYACRDDETPISIDFTANERNAYMESKEKIVRKFIAIEPNLLIIILSTKKHSLPYFIVTSAIEKRYIILSMKALADWAYHFV